MQIDTVLQSMKADKRVVFPQNHAPVDPSLAEAMVNLSTAVAKGDATAMGSLLSPESRDTLAELTASGQWADATGKIEGVRVVMLSETPGAERGTASSAIFQTAIQEPGKAYVLGWKATKNGSVWLLDGADASREVRTRATDFEGGAAASSSPTASAAGGADMNEFLIRTWALGQVYERIKTATGRDLASEEFAKMGFTTTDEMKTKMAAYDEQAKRLVESGVQISDAGLAKLVAGGKAAAAQTGGKVTDEQVEQWIAEILRLPLDRIKGGGAAAPSGGTAPTAVPRPSRGRPGAG